MDLPLGLNDAREDAIEVFTRLFDVFSATTFVEFDGLQDVATFPFVADTDRNDVEFAQRFDLILRLTHAEHLDDSLVGVVVSVLGTPVALGYPYAFVPLEHGMADVIAQMARRHIEIAHASSTLHPEHFVRLADVGHQSGLHQIGTKGNLGGLSFVFDEQLLKQQRVENNVAMI